MAGQMQILFNMFCLTDESVVHMFDKLLLVQTHVCILNEISFCLTRQKYTLSDRRNP